MFLPESVVKCTGRVVILDCAVSFAELFVGVSQALTFPLCDLLPE